MKSSLLVLAAMTACVVSRPAMAQTLKIGDDAPKLEVSRWVKGEKIDKLEKNQTYVVEFWATWCGPCKRSIPHLTELQKQYKDKGVKIIGVSIWERKPTSAEPFVEQMGDKMDYSVALDAVPSGEEASQGAMAKNWMLASGSDGIPTAFLIKNGKILWIGDPMELDKPLEKAVEPNFNLAKAIIEAKEERAKSLAQVKAEREQEQALEKKFEALQERLEKLGENPTPKQAIEAIDQSFAESPELEQMLGWQKYGWMIQAGDKKASAYGTKLVKGVYKDDPQMLNDLAWANLDDDNNDIPADQRDFKFALMAATRANELTKGEDAQILDTLAAAYFKTGDIPKAVSTQEKAVGLIPSGDESKKMNERLKKYRKAAADKKP